MVDENDVRRISKLAKLQFSDSDIKNYVRDLNSIVALCKKIDLVDTSSLSQDIHPEDRMPEREDVCLECDKSVMDNAPDKLYDMFAVPKVIE